MTTETLTRQERKALDQIIGRLRRLDPDVEEIKLVACIEVWKGQPRKIVFEQKDTVALN